MQLSKKYKIVSIGPYLLQSVFELSGGWEDWTPPQLFAQPPSNNLSDTPLSAFHVSPVATDPQLFDIQKLLISYRLLQYSNITN